MEHSMTIRFCMLSILCLFVIAPAHAQNCQTTPQAIEGLYSPRLGTYSLWDIIFGTPIKQESFNSFYPLNEKEVLLAGVQRGEFETRPIIAVINRKGRTVWKWLDEDKGRAITIKRIFPMKDGKFLVVGSIKREGKPEAVWVAKFDREGKKTHDKLIEDKRAHMRFGDLLQRFDGPGYLLAVQEFPQNAGEGVTPNTRFVLLDGSFKTRKSRSFVTGSENKIFSLKAAQNEVGEQYYIAVGETRDTYDRPAGLILKLDANMNIEWQRLYPRGVGGRFLKAGTSKDGDFLALGEVLPTTPEAPPAGWLMQVDADSGIEIWERYYTRSDMAYKGVSMASMEDGRTVILLGGKTSEEDDIVDHARVLALSPRGNILRDVSYTSGTGVTPQKLMIGEEGLLYIGGSVVIDEPDPRDPENERIQSSKGWLVVGESFDPYEDPCIIKKRTF